MNFNGQGPIDISDWEQIRAPWMKPSEYILIQGTMYAEDDAWIQDQLVTTEVGQKLAKSGMNLKLQIGTVKLATLRRMVKGWNILLLKRQPDGSMLDVPLPFSIENICRLPKSYADFIHKEIDDRNPDMSELEQQDFLTPASSVIEAYRE